jgi:hypothetical protein
MTKECKSADWLKHLKSRAKLARQWRNELEEHRRLAGDFIYVRIRGVDFRPISISPTNPCGRLIKRRNEVPLEGTANIKNAIRSVEDAKPADYFRPNTGKENAKPEHKIQASLIHYALRNNLAFQDMFDNFESVFDELLFVTDELSAGNIRADIIALGRRAKAYFPVFIELKVKRNLSRLIEQLEAAKKAAEIAQDDFIEFLSAATGVEKQCIVFEPKSIIIWIESESGNESKAVRTARNTGYITAEIQSDGRISFVDEKANG